MPSSSLLVAPMVLHLVNTVPKVGKHLRVLDVGPGWGKYAVLLREYVDPEISVVGLEAWNPYIRKHRLDRLYDPILQGDVCDQTSEYLASFDVVMMVDVIEHIDKEAGTELLARMPTWLVVSTPRDFFHNPAGLPPTEKHRSHWTIEDFEETGRLDQIDMSLYEQIGGIVVRLSPVQ